MNNDIRSKIKALLKRNRWLYLCYNYVMSLVVNFIKLFVTTDEKLILFVSFGGRRCTDSPRAIYDYMLKDSRFEGYKLVWGVVDTQSCPDINNKVKIDTLKYYITSLKARSWITNVLVERGLSYSGKHTFYLYTGHGSPLKKCGVDENNKGHFKSASKGCFNAGLAQSEFEREIRGRLMGLPLNEVYLTGAPTNDILSNYNEEYRNSVRDSLGIKKNKRAILYAPTFREYRNFGTFDMKDVDFDKWHNILGDDYVILYRAHPIAMYNAQNNKEWFIDVTSYERIEPLMIASDVLISDYSGLIPDYSIMEKPIYLWTYDYEEYTDARGLYFDIRKVLPSTPDEETLLSLIKTGFTEEQKDLVLKFKKEYATVCGSATTRAVDLIYNKIISM